MPQPYSKSEVRVRAPAYLTLENNQPPPCFSKLWVSFRSISPSTAKHRSLYPPSPAWHEKSAELSVRSLLFHCLHFLYLLALFTLSVRRGWHAGKLNSLIEARPLRWLFGVIRMSLAALRLDGSSATFGIRVQRENALIRRPALLITERELTASTCLGAERSFPVALLGGLPFQFNSVLTGYLRSIKRSPGGWGRCFRGVPAQIIFNGFLDRSSHSDFAEFEMSKLHLLSLFFFLTQYLQ